MLSETKQANVLLRDNGRFAGRGNLWRRGVKERPIFNYQAQGFLGVALKTISTATFVLVLLLLVLHTTLRINQKAEFLEMGFGAKMEISL